MIDTSPVIEKLSQTRTRCIMQISDAEKHLLEKQATEKMGNTLTLKGFRPGKAPPDSVREHCGPERITEEMIHLFLTKTLPALLKEQHLTPIIHPKVELMSHAPITLSITIVEKPPVKFRRKDALRITKKDITITDEDVTKTLDTLKEKHTIEEWTDAAVQKQWGLPSLVELRTSITSALKRQKEQAEQKRREETFFEQVQESIEIDLAPELLEDEERQMLGSLQENLRSQNLSFTEWLKRTGKTEETFRTDLRRTVERRLRLRFGIDALLQEHNISVSEEEMPLYAPGGESVERFRWQRRMQKLLTMFLN